MNSALLLLSAALFTWGIGEGMFIYFQPLYLQQLGANPLLIGSILGAAGLAMTVAHIPAGYLSDKVGRRPMLRAAWLFGLVAAWVMASARTLTVFVAGLLLYSFTAFVVSPLNSYVTAASKKWSIGRTLTTISAMYNFGAVIGPFVGGLLGDALGLRSVYLAAASVFIVSTAVIFFLPPQPLDGHDPGSPPAKLLLNGRYLGFLALSFFVMFAMFLPQPLTPNFLQNVRGLSLSQIGQLGSLGGFGNALLSLTLGRLEAYLGFVLGQVFTGLFALLIWRGEGMWLFGLAYFLLGGYRATRPLAIAQVRTLVHKSQMGLAYGLSETVNSLPAVLAPPLAGYLYTSDPASIYPLGLILIILGVILTLFFVPRRQGKAAVNG
ncbi:MAG: MFS transporter [Chloroflexi bacterium]|nr:MFS transporter [Chloroflexota bacterium]